MPLSERWIYVVFVVLFLFEAVQCAVLEHRFSEEGIAVRGLFIRRSWSWSQVQQARILLAMTRRHIVHEEPWIIFTFPGGKIRKRYQRYWIWSLKNPFGTGLAMYYGKEIHEMVLRCYGPLDFDLLNNPDEEVTVVD